MARKPKVYAAEIDGLHEWIVAAPNQADALAAFGVNQNLFQQGLARTTEEPEALAAAQASPGMPLRRLKGSNEPYRPAGAGGADAWAQAAKASGLKARSRTARKKPDRKALDAAERELKAFEATAAEEQAALDREFKALERRRRDLVAAQDRKRAVLRRRIEQERRRFEAQG
jgi:hypothetical protein